MSFDSLASKIYSIYKDKESIPLHEPFFNKTDKDFINDCIDSSYVSSNGKFLTKLEESISSFTGAKYVNLFVNGTSALHLALLASGLKQDQEVISQSLTFVATLNAISYIGAKTVLIDIERKSLGIDPMRLKEWLEQNTVMKNDECINLSSGNKIHACVPMHTFGIPSKIEEIVDICNNKNILVIEDCAESMGSFLNEKHTGLFGSAGVLSFNGNKLITTGGGGAIITNDADFSNKLRHIGTTAKVNHEYEFIHNEIGYNYRMPNINAALGCAQITRINSYLQSKREIFDMYADFFSHYEHANIITTEENVKSNNWLITVLYDSNKKRDEDLNNLLKSKIFARIPWRPMHLLGIHNIELDTNLDNTEYLYKHALNLPSSPYLKEHKK